MTTTNYPGDPLSGSTTSGTGGGMGGGMGGSGDDKKEQARQAAGTAADESKHVAAVAKDEAGNVAAEAKQQARGLLDEAMGQVDEQSRTQRDRLVETMRTFSDDLEQMASQGGRQGMATDIARQVAGKARDLSSHLDGREPADLLDELRGFARRKPGVFLFGALAAGVVAGRLTRGAKDAQSGSGSATPSPYDQPRGTAAGAPVAGLPPTPPPAPIPPTPPVYGSDPGPSGGLTGSAPQPVDPLSDPAAGGSSGLPPERF